MPRNKEIKKVLVIGSGPKMKKYFENSNQFEVVRIIIKIIGKKTFEKFHNLTLLTMALQIV